MNERSRGPRVFWTEENLGTQVFQVERWLQRLATAPHSPSPTPPARVARILFVLDNDYGELATVMYLLLGQLSSIQATLLLPDRLYAHNADLVRGRTHRYTSLDDVMQAVDRDEPEVVLLCSGYLLSAHRIFTLEALEHLLALLAQRGCRVGTTDPFLGMLSKQNPRTLLRMHVPIDRAAEERMWDHFTRAEQILRDRFHLYPSYAPVAEQEATRTDARNVAFFNPCLLLPRSDSSPHWLFILARADYETQVMLEGESAFVDIVADKLLETSSAGKHPILIGPPDLVEQLASRLPAAERIDLLSYCPFTRFLSLLLCAEQAFYWNLVSHSLLVRLFNQLPIVLFDRGHLLRSAGALYGRVVEWYYQGHEPRFRDHRQPLTSESLSSWARAERRHLAGIGRRFRRAPSPQRMVEDLFLRPG